MIGNKYRWLAVGLLSMAVGCVMIVLLYLLLTLPAAAPPPPASQPTLPPVPAPTATVSPLTIEFEAEQPITGYTSCDSFGFNGQVTAGAGQPAVGIKVVVWENERDRLLTITPTDANGRYQVILTGAPADRDLRIQLYQNDRPVSEPLLTKIYFDCEHGFQVYQINWLKKGA